MQRFIVSYGKNNTFTLETSSIEHAKRMCPNATIAPIDGVPEYKNGLQAAFAKALGV